MLHAFYGRRYHMKNRRSQPARVVLIDVGNTSTTIGVRIGAKVRRVTDLATVGTRGGSAREALDAVGADEEVAGVVYASVVPECDSFWLKHIHSRFGINPLVVDSRLNLGVRIVYPNASSLGADRLANVCGAVRKYGAPVIVCDFGTAATFDVVTRDKRFVGGVIAPGLGLMTDYMADRTSQLPRIALAGGRCDRVFGKSTVEAMQIGVRTGSRGMVREILAGLRTYSGLRRARICATGGHAVWLKTNLAMKITIDPDLTLFGLAAIHELNSGTG